MEVSVVHEKRVSEVLFMELRKKERQVDTYLAQEPDLQAEEDRGMGCCSFGRREPPEPEEVLDRDLQRQRQQQEKYGSLADLWVSLNSDARLQWKRWRLAKFVDSAKFQQLFATLVIVNGLLIGVQADVASSWSGWIWIELGFVILFFVEIGLKLIAFRGWFWGDSWNVFDFLVVLLSAVELALVLITGNGSSIGLSSFRLIRILRVVRVLGMFQHLNLLVGAFLRAMKGAIWVAVLLVMIIYIFAILGRGLFGESGTLEDHNEATWAASNQFRSVPRSMATLLQVMTADSWASMVANPIGDVMPAAWLYFTLFVVVVGLGLLNLLTGVFLESLLEITSERKEDAKVRARKEKRKMLHLVGELFKQFDNDHGNTLDEEEIPVMLQSLVKYQRHLEQVGIPFAKLKQACEISDYDHTRRSYDPTSNTHYHDHYQWAPDFDRLDADVGGKEHLTESEYTTAFGQTSKKLQRNEDTVLPEGIMEGELINCLMSMDEPLVKADYFTMMKRIRLMERRLLQAIQGKATEMPSFDTKAAASDEFASDATKDPNKVAAGEFPIKDSCENNTGILQPVHPFEIIPAKESLNFA